MIDEGTSLVDVCFAVCTKLDSVGIVAVLSGGSAATVYAPQAYQSRDADFIITLHTSSSSGSTELGKLGYREQNGMYVHALSPYTVEFPRGPLAIGDDLIDSWATMHRDDTLLYILTRTDCVRNRLANYYFYNDLSALHAALGVAASGEIDIDVVREWSARERELAKYQDFVDALKLSRGK